MMKKTILFLLILALIPVCHAQDPDALWFYKSRYLTLDINLSTGFDVVSTSPHPDIDYIIANITFFPKELPGQRILNHEFSPSPVFSDGTAVFQWDNPVKKRLDLDMDFAVRVDETPVKVHSKIDFPIDGLHSDLELYTKPADIIDVNDDIITTASEIASGKDDLFDVVDSVAVWVNSNIEYNFSTVTAEASQKASWVLDNKVGVCDELTSLFISMVRSLGIPARFVAGISYTNSDEFENKWGAHGWAEVYFPGYGWVPFDVTYGQYGWVDATHIVSHVSNDAGKVVSNYQWGAKDTVSLDLEDIKTDVQVAEIGPDRDRDVSIRLDMFKDEVSFGSYNIVTASITNNKNYYVSKDIFISKTSRIEVLEGYKKHIMLRPGEVKQVYWMLKVDDSLDQDYIYTFPIEVYTLENITSKIKFSSVYEAPDYSFDELVQILSEIDESNGHAYSKNIDVNCSADKKEYYSYEKPAITCSMKNIGNIFFKDLEVCMLGECTAMHLGITQEKNLNFTVEDTDLGRNILPFTIGGDDLSIEKDVWFDVIDGPVVSIRDMEYPAQVKYATDFSINLVLKKDSDSEARNVRLVVTGPGISKVYNYEVFDNDLAVSVPLQGRDLKEGSNKISIDLIYEDRNGRQYTASEDAEVSLVDVNIVQKILLWLRSFFR